jgi:hypothetical protein
VVEVAVVLVVVVMHLVIPAEDSGHVGAVEVEVEVVVDLEPVEAVAADMGLVGGILNDEGE